MRLQFKFRHKGVSKNISTSIECAHDFSLEQVKAPLALNMSFHKPCRLPTLAEVGVDYKEYGIRLWLKKRRNAGGRLRTDRQILSQRGMDILFPARYIIIHRLQILSDRTRHFPKHSA